MDRPILLLDVMDTLVWDPFRLLPEFFGMDWPELMARKHPTAWHAFERDELTEAEFLRSFLRDGEGGFDGAAMVELFRTNYRLLDGVPALLDELKQQGVAMHALSNYPRWSQLIEAELGLSRWLRWSFVSWKTGVRKPDPQAYLGAAAELGVEPGACLFVDDRESNCAAARDVGMPAVRFEGAQALRAELVGRGVLG